MLRNTFHWISVLSDSPQLEEDPTHNLLHRWCLYGHNLQNSGQGQAKSLMPVYLEQGGPCQARVEPEVAHRDLAKQSNETGKQCAPLRTKLDIKQQPRSSPMHYYN